jgi:hypothetical protein
MQTLYDILVGVHVAAWAIVLIGYVKDVKGPAVNALMVNGLRAAFVLGIVLVGLASGSDAVEPDPNNIKVAVKLVIAFVAVGLAEATRKKGAPNPLAHVVAGLVVVNVVIAYAWR